MDIITTIFRPGASMIRLPEKLANKVSVLPLKAYRIRISGDQNPRT